MVAMIARLASIRMNQERRFVYRAIKERCNHQSEQWSATNAQKIMLLMRFNHIRVNHVSVDNIREIPELQSVVAVVVDVLAKDVSTAQWGIKEAMGNQQINAHCVALAKLPMVTGRQVVKNVNSVDMVFTMEHARIVR
tara:strand:- start:280 stop:693 length:414 start_codon:yes stop_codon:yes gene_type:complete